jgi:sugar phosphate isomerase/epimerase
MDAVRLLLSAGAVPVFAHPFTMSLGAAELERFVDDLVDAGLKGIEGYHGDWSEAEQAPLRALGEARGLIVSGGSDYHGHMRPDRGMPGGKHGVLTPDGVLDDLKEARATLDRSSRIQARQGGPATR